MNHLIIGQYVPGDSVVHRLDPRAKLVGVLLFVIIIFIANNIATYACLALFTLIAIGCSSVPLRYLYKGLRPVLWLVLLTFFLHVFMTHEGRLLVEWGWLQIYSGGILRGLFISLRIFFLVMITTLLTLTTPPIEITDGLEVLLGPLKKIRLPVHEFSLMISIALRFIPTLMEEAEKIIKAQTARGIDFRSGPIKERLKAMIPLLVPLFISAFKRAEDLALAMEARGYHGGEGRTKLRQLSWRFRDTLLMALFIVLTGALFLLRSYV